jgi:hypothetical protein
MDARRAAPTAGLVACLLTLVVLAVPYLVAETPAVNTYYTAGAITPWATGLFATVGVIVFAAGREERSDPALVAGVGLVLGAFMVVIALAWATTVRVDALGTDSPLWSYHRWVLSAASALAPVSAGLYTRTLGLL